MSENKENNKISDIIKTSLENIRNVVDADTIIGNPITSPSGVTILPVSKVSVGFASGGFDYLGKNAAKNDKSGNNFGGGGGSGLSVEPVAFLVISPDGGVELLPITVPKSDISSIIDGAPALIDKIKALFPKKDKKDDEESEKPDENPNEENGGQSE
ncbi:MAG: GerW family sporulation protein [Firmicutes bacterium]|nr:GerW family sporulation protein [Bacillota bacterium]MCD8312206.1 GerW family sporulation protein [Bacillota bacterium]MCD8314793.1 GerW family sporulation protein [Bacillota bacterium]